MLAMMAHRTGAARVDGEALAVAFAEPDLYVVGPARSALDLGNDTAFLDLHHTDGTQICIRLLDFSWCKVALHIAEGVTGFRIHGTVGLGD
jgi:hypothetical protein